MNWAASLPPQKTSYPQVSSLDSQVTFFEALKIQWFPSYFSSIKDDSERKERQLLGRLKILCFVNWFEQETCAGRSRITPLKFKIHKRKRLRRTDIPFPRHICWYPFNPFVRVLWFSNIYVNFQGCTLPETNRMHGMLTHPDVTVAFVALVVVKRCYWIFTRSVLVSWSVVLATRWLCTVDWGGWPYWSSSFSRLLDLQFSCIWR